VDDPDRPASPAPLAPRRIVCLVILVPFFADMALRPETYTSGTLTAVLAFAPARLWGIVMTALALWVGIKRRSPMGAVALAALLAGWSAGLIASVVTGDSQAPLAWAFYVGPAAILVWGLGRGGHQ